MRISTKCSVALHCLVLVGAYQHRVKITSELLAKSTGCNPVVVRNITSGLKKAGILKVPRGQGGATLALPPEDITLWMVYSAVDVGELEHLIGLHPNPLQECPVGGVIYAVLEEPYREIGAALRGRMEKITLADLLRDFYALRAGQ